MNIFVTKLAFKTFGGLTHLIKVKGVKGGGKGSKVVLMGAILLHILAKKNLRGCFLYMHYFKTLARTHFLNRANVPIPHRIQESRGVDKV